MKKTSILFCVLFSIFCYSQREINRQWKNQVNPIFNGLSKTRIPNGILMDYAMEFTNVPAYKGILADSLYIDPNVLGNIYKTLCMGRVVTSTQNFPKIETVALNWARHRQTYNQTEQNTLVITGLFYQYSRIKADALQTNKITVSNNRYYDKYINGVWQNPYETLSTVAFTPAINDYNKRRFAIVLPQNLMLSNASSQIQKIEINFNDGTGYKTLVVNQKVFANYTQNGIFDWVFKTTLTNGSVLYSHTKMKIEQNFTTKPWSQRHLITQ